MVGIQGFSVSSFGPGRAVYFRVNYGLQVWSVCFEDLAFTVLGFCVCRALFGLLLQCQQCWFGSGFGDLLRGCLGLQGYVAPKRREDSFLEREP